MKLVQCSNRLIIYCKDKIRAFKNETLSVFFVAKDSRTPVMVRIMAGLIAAYALSPIDLVPDFIPVIGVLDDILFVVGGLYMIMKFIDDVILESARARALSLKTSPVSYAAAVVVVLIWFLAIYWLLSLNVLW